MKPNKPTTPTRPITGAVIIHKPIPWVIPITGRTSGTASNGTIVFSATKNINLIASGSLVINTVTRTADPTGTSIVKHTVSIRIINNASGALVIEDSDEILSCGNYNDKGNPTVNFYTGVNTTAPILTWNLNDIPRNVKKIRQITGYTTILLITGDKALPKGLTFIDIAGYVNWTYSGPLPSGLVYLKLNSNNIDWTYSGPMPIGLKTLFLNGPTIKWTYFGPLPTGLLLLYINSSSVQWSYSGALPIGLGYLSISGSAINWTGLNVGSGITLSPLTLTKYRQEKMSSTDIVTLLTQITNRIGAVGIVTINDYADYANPPVEVIDAVDLLKSTKSITTVNLGA